MVGLPSSYELCVMFDRWAEWSSIIRQRPLRLTMLQYDADKSRWHWSMWPLIDLFGFPLVWSVGLEALGYPPTLVDLPAEAEMVELALLKL